MLAREIKNIIMDVSKIVGISVDNETIIEKLALYFLLLFQWNQKLNLTGKKELNSIVKEHLPDPLIVSTSLKNGVEAVDVGSGAGVVGIVLKILRPDIKVALVESNIRKVVFLRRAIYELGLIDIRVYPQRVEELISKVQFDVGMARAFLPPLKWLALAQKLVKKEGNIIFFINKKDDPFLKELNGNLVVTKRVDYFLEGRERVVIIVGAPLNKRGEGYR